MLTNGNITATITVGGTCQGTACGALGQGPAATSLVFSPATTLTDPSGNSAAGTLSTSIRLF